MNDDATQFDPAFQATQAAGSNGTTKFTPPVSAARTTVLPNIEADGTTVLRAAESRNRYEPARLLGSGGMGEVVLVNDQDIGRKVALKRLLPEVTDLGTLARFVDEIRTVGRLEHPNIVPIHDVGVDEQGRYFFVMKYVHGETLESIIEKLVAGDPEKLAAYTTEACIEILLGLLHALEYAHSQGIVHRDIKPANIMVGRFGEVVLMDWGIAKPLSTKRDPLATLDGTLHDDSPRARLYATRVGALIGTPAYMSPEQTGADAAKIDARSDLYSAMVVFHELLGHEHYLAAKKTLPELLTAIQSERIGFFKLLGMRKRPPAEIIHVLAKGLEKDPAQRFQSAGELIAALHEILEGKVKVQCQITLTKRTFREMGRVVDRAPWVGFFALIAIVAALVFAGVEVVRVALRLV